MSDQNETKEKETAVTKWLENHNASGYINDFYGQGYYEMEVVDDKAIETIVKEQPGIANTLKKSLAEYNKYTSGKPMDPPKLPPGTELDLSAPELPAHEDVTFSISKSLSVEGVKEDITLPNLLTREQWIQFVHGANLLYAYDMDSDEPKYAKTPILDWKEPERKDYVRSEISHAKVTSELTYSEDAASYVTSGFDKQTATAGFLFCAASIERNHKYKTARSSKNKTIIRVGMWKYPRAQIYLDKCTIPSQRFKKAIENALGASDQYAELNKVFKEYGHVIPSSVLVGGQLCYQQSYNSEQYGSEKSTEEEWKTAFERKKGDVSASIGFGIGRGSETDTGSVDLKEFSSFTNQGGDSLLCSNPAAWAPTVNVPALWAVIEMEDMRPTIDFLDVKTRQEVLSVWRKYEEAIFYPIEIKDLDAVYPDHFRSDDKNKAVMVQHSGFAAGLRHCSDGSRGSVELFSSTFGGDPKAGEPGVAYGAAYAHFKEKHVYKGEVAPDRHRGDNWIESSSICIPIPKGGSFRSKFESKENLPEARLIYIPSSLVFGEWESIEVPSAQYQDIAKEDGFLFVNIEATQDRAHGGVKVKFNNGNQSKEIAGSYVHFCKQDGEYIYQQNCCVPVPKGTDFLIVREEGEKSPEVRAYWLPIVDTRWEMKEAVPVSLNTEIGAKENGILHGWIRNTTGDDRGTLKIYTGEEIQSQVEAEQLPSVAAAMHYYPKNKRYVNYSSVMLPIARETNYKAVFYKSKKHEHHNPKAEVYWTAIVPR